MTLKSNEKCNTEVNVYSTRKAAEYDAYDFYYGNMEEINKKRKFPYMRFDMKDGRTVYFMDINEYDAWCLGRTYVRDGELYHSGHKIKKKLEKQ